MRGVLAAVLLLSSTGSALAADSNPLYHGDQVFRVPVLNEDDGAQIRGLVEKLGLEVWQPPSKKGAFADLHVPAGQVGAFKDAMKEHEVTTMHENLRESIMEEGKYQVYAAGSANETWFQSYHPYADHLQWLNDLASQHPANAKVVASGNTFEDNPITGLHIFGREGPGKKPAAVIHGTVHAREWIASMVVEYLTSELIFNYGSDEAITAFVDKYDFYMLPIVNVDGFKYTHTTDRMWRKNRQTTPGSKCLGHDINRNWPYKWDIPYGASKDPCQQAFRGVTAGDAPETQALLRFLEEVHKAQGVKLYMDFHSYSQLFMTPYAYSCSAPPHDLDELSLAKGAVDAISAVHNVEFQYGPICSTIYQVSGSSVDYVADVIKGQYNYAVELRDRGEKGFVLPPEQILPSGEETFAGFKYLLENMK